MEFRCELSKGGLAKTPYLLLGLRLGRSAIRFVLSPNCKVSWQWDDLKITKEGGLGLLRLGPVSVSIRIGASTVKGAQGTLEGWK